MLQAYHQCFLQNNEVKPSRDFNNDFMNEGVSIYEVVRIIKSKILFFEEHFDRLENSAKLLSLDLWFNKNEVLQKMKQLTELNRLVDGNIEFIFHLSESGEESFYCLFIEDRYPTPEMIQNGVASDLHYAERENPNAKVINLDLRSKTTAQIKSNELYEVLLVDKKGFITEGSRSNIFFIKENEIFTTPITEVLAGITRMKVLEMCKKNEIPVHEKTIKAEEINQFDAAFFTGTSPKVLPILNIGDATFNPQLPLMKKLVSLFDQLIEEHLTHF